MPNELIQTNISRFKAFQEDIIKQNKLYSKAYVKAILGCVEQFEYVSNPPKKRDLMFVKGSQQQIT